MALTPEEEIELIELEQESRRRRAASDNKPAKAEDKSYTPGTPMDAFTQGMLGNQYGAKQVSADDAKTVAVPLVRYGGALLGAEGGPSGMAFTGGGEKLAQWMSGEDDPRALAQAMVQGGIPMGAVAKFSKAAVPVVSTAAGYGVDKLADLVMGKDDSMPSAEKRAAFTAVITSLIPALSKPLGAILGTKVKGPAYNNPSLMSAEDRFIEGRAKKITVNPADLKQSSWLADKTMGVEAMKKDVQGRNVAPVQSALREDIGLPASTQVNAAGASRNTILPDDIKLAQDASMVPYKQAASLSPDASDALNTLKTARGDYRKAYQNWLNDTTGQPSTKDAMMKAKEAMDAAEERMALHAETSENPALKNPLSELTAAEKDASLAKERFDQYQLKRKNSSLLPNFEGRNINDALNPDNITNPSASKVDTSSVPLAQIGPGERAEMERYVNAQARINKARADIAAVSKGTSQLGDAIKAGRTQYAKTIPIDEATGIGNRLTNVGDLEAMHQDNWSGNSDLLAKMKQAFPDAFTDPGRVRNPSAGKLQAMSAANNLSHGNAAGVAVNAIPVIGDIMRARQLSEKNQDRMMQVIMDARNGIRADLDPKTLAILQRLSALGVTNNAK